MQKVKKQTQKQKESIYDSIEPKTPKRIAAWVVDFILVLVIATGIAFITSKIYRYDYYSSVVTEKYEEYGVYALDEKGEYVLDTNGNKTFCDEKDEECKNKVALLFQDADFQKAYRKMQYGSTIIVSFGLGISLLIFEFILPLFLKHGRTLGMRFFDVGYVTDEGIEPKSTNLFVRFLFGKLILEALIPYISLMYILQGSGFGLVGLLAILGIYGFDFGMKLFSKDKRGIHDYIAKLKPVDNSNQIYCKTTQELAKNKAEEASFTAYKKRY